MSAAIRESFSQIEVELIAGAGGNFIVRLEGTTLWDRKGADGRFPEHDEIISRIDAFLASRGGDPGHSG